MKKKNEGFSRKETVRFVDTSREIVVDVMFLTTDLMHSIRNNLPVDMEAAQQEVSTIERDGNAYARTVIAQVDLPPSRRKRAWVVLMALIVMLIGGGIGGVWALMTYQSSQVDKAVLAAHTAVSKWHELVVDDAMIMASIETEGRSPEDTLKLLDLLEGSDTSAAQIARMSALFELGRLDEAREVALKASLAGVESPVITKIFNTWTFPTAVDFEQTLIATKTPFHFETLIDGKTHDVYVAGEDGGWQDILAASRLCQILKCAFGLPSVQWVQIPSHTIPADEEAETSKEDKTYHAVVVERPTGKGFEIERTRNWRKLLQPSKELNPEEVTRARQLSTLLMFDFLANNWTRFRARKAQWGSSVTESEGELIAQLTPNMFQTRSSKRVRGRMNWAQRVDTDFAARVRLLEILQIAPQLFPVETPDREDKIAALTQQHRELVKRLKDLETSFGKAEIEL